MKKAFNSFIIFIFTIAVIFVVGFSISNDKSNTPFTPGKIINNIKKVSEEINTLKISKDFEVVNLFYYNQYPKNLRQQNSFVSKASNLIIKNEALRNILLSPKENITFKIPMSKTEFIELELTRTNIFSKDAKFFTINSSGKTPFNYSQGLYYKGIIKGDNNSLAGISIFEDNVMGIISCSKGNYVLGKINDKQDNVTNDYVFYNDKDLKLKSKFDCNVDDYNEKLIKVAQNALIDAEKIKNGNPDNINSILPIRVNLEVDYQFYLDKDTVIRRVTDHIATIFLFVMNMYQNEQIPLELNEFNIWTQIDPYASLNNALDILKLLGVRNKDNFEANIVQLISSGHNQNLGGIAWDNVLCQPYNELDSSGRFSFSNIDTILWAFPTYSWAVKDMAHEIGHNIGSKHTNACVWPIAPGVIGAIDSCVTAEGNCFSTTQPDSNGTIMSSCELNGAVNFSLGFGQLPGDTLRYRYSKAICLHKYVNSSEIPDTTILVQNYPNPFNPVTKIDYAISKDAYVTLKIFDITGREVAMLVNNRFYSRGYYTFNFNASDYSLSSGVYFYQMVTFDAVNPNNITYTQVKKMILTK